jgi:hypothetical protein
MALSVLRSMRSFAIRNDCTALSALCATSGTPEILLAD